LRDVRIYLTLAELRRQELARIMQVGHVEGLIVGEQLPLHQLRPDGTRHHASPSLGDGTREQLEGHEGAGRGGVVVDAEVGVLGRRRLGHVQTDFRVL
jgi:hypothetical protein